MEVAADVSAVSWAGSLGYVSTVTSVRHYLSTVPVSYGSCAAPVLSGLAGLHRSLLGSAHRVSPFLSVLRFRWGWPSPHLQGH